MKRIYVFGTKKKSIKANLGALSVFIDLILAPNCLFMSVKIRKNAQNIRFLFQQIDPIKTSVIIHNGKKITMPFYSLWGKRTPYITMHKIERLIKQRI